MKKRGPEIVDIHVGAQIKMRRLMLKMSQTDLATTLGLTFQQVQKYEKGANRVGASRLQQIAASLQVPVAFFFEGISSGKPGSNVGATRALPEHANRMLTTRDGIALIQAFTRIKDRKLRHIVITLIERLAESSG